jgi:heat shock protein HslJ
MKNLILSLGFLAILVSACAPTPSADILGSWTLVAYGDPSNPTPALPNVETSIEFKSDGALSGNVGCNGFGGDYKVTGEAIEFGPVMMTEMFCEAIAEQESAVVKVLTGSAGFSLEGNTLTITSEDGSAVIVLARK